MSVKLEKNHVIKQEEVGKALYNAMNASLKLLDSQIKLIWIPDGHSYDLVGGKITKEKKWFRREEYHIYFRSNLMSYSKDRPQPILTGQDMTKLTIKSKRNNSEQEDKSIRLFFEAVAKDTGINVLIIGRISGEDKA